MSKINWNERRPLRKGELLVILLIFGVVVGYYQWKSKVSEYTTIKSGYGFTNGHIISLGKKLYNTIHIDVYKYEVDGVSYEVALRNYRSCEFKSKADQRAILEFTYPIIYSVKDPEISRLLILPGEFRKFDMKFPDSLQVFYQKYWSCHK